MTSGHFITGMEKNNKKVFMRKENQKAFGNGGTSVDPTGIITYLTPNSTGTSATLYNQTYIFLDRLYHDLS